MAIIKNPFMVVGDKNPLIAASEEELNALLMSKNTGKAVSYNGNMYVIEESEPDKPAATILYKPEVLGVPLSADTEEKANALLVENKVGSIFKYTGEGGGAATVNPTAVGDTVTQIFFDTTKSAEEIYADLQKLTYQEEHGMQYAWLFGTKPFTAEGYCVVYKNEADGKVVYMIDNGGENYIFAYSPDMTPAEVGFEKWGWQTTSPNTNYNNVTYTIEEVNGKDIWGSWLSASDQFASGSASAYKKDKLYLIEAGGTENPTAVGDTCSQVYFDTTKSAEEVYQDLLKLDWQEMGGMQYVWLFGTEPFTADGYCMAMKNEVADGKFVYMIDNGGENFIYVYSPDLTPAEADIGFTEWGWQTTSPNTNYNNVVYTIEEVNGKDIWGSWLSASDQFASIGGTPKTKPLSVATGTLSITENGTFNVEDKEEVFVNVLSENIDTLISRTIPCVESDAEEVGDYAFYNCQNLTSVNFPRATSIGQYAFGNCTALTRADFETATHIGGYAFNGCENLTLILRNTSNVASIDVGGGLGDTVTIYVPDELVESYKTEHSTFAAQIKGLSELAE